MIFGVDVTNAARSISHHPNADFKVQIANGASESRNPNGRNTNDATCVRRLRAKTTHTTSESHTRQIKNHGMFYTPQTRPSNTCFSALFKTVANRQPYFVDIDAARWILRAEVRPLRAKVAARIVCVGEIQIELAP
jgi:uracil-DNA glycosylase